MGSLRFQLKKKKLNINSDAILRDQIFIGHSVVPNKPRQFQDLGHNAILIVGDYTAMIGDPSGKKTRPQLLMRKQGYLENHIFLQAGKILILTKQKFFTIPEWLAKIDLRDLIGVLSRFTVQRILERMISQTD